MPLLSLPSARCVSGRSGAQLAETLDGQPSFDVPDRARMTSAIRSAVVIVVNHQPRAGVNRRTSGSAQRLPARAQVVTPALVVTPRLSTSGPSVDHLSAIAR